MSLLLKALENAAKNRASAAPGTGGDPGSPASSAGRADAELSLEPIVDRTFASAPSGEIRTEFSPERGPSPAAAQNVLLAGMDSSRSAGLGEYLRNHPLVVFSTAAGLFAIGYGVYLYLQIAHPGILNAWRTTPVAAPVAPPPEPIAKGPVAQPVAPPAPLTPPAPAPADTAAAVPPAPVVPATTPGAAPAPATAAPPSASTTAPVAPAGPPTAPAAAPPAPVAAQTPGGPAPPAAPAPVSTPTQSDAPAAPPRAAAASSAGTAPAAASGGTSATAPSSGAARATTTPAGKPAADGRPQPRVVARPAPKPATPQPASKPPADGIAVGRDAAPVVVLPAVAAGYQALEQGRYADAEKSYRDALVTDARNMDALLGLATALVQLGRTDAASPVYMRALEIDPRNATAQAGLLALIGRTDPSAAESRLKQLISREPSAFLHFTLGNLYADQGQWAAAQTAYFQAHNLAPDNPDYAYNLAVGLEHLSQPKIALNYYRRAAQIARDRGHAQFDAARVEARIRTLEAALGR